MYASIIIDYVLARKSPDLGGREIDAHLMPLHLPTVPGVSHQATLSPLGHPLVPDIAPGRNLLQHRSVPSHV